MKITTYLASLLPSFGKERVLEDCRITKTEIKEFTLPSYVAAEQLLKNWKFKSKNFEPLIGSFDRLVKKSGNDNMIVTIHKAFKPLMENLDHVEEMIEKTYSEEVAGAGFTYLKANLLQFVECCAFVSKFARKLLVYAYICETAEFEQGGTSLAESLSPAEIEWINANFVSFCTALKAVSTVPTSIKKSLEDIPDVVVTSENASTLASTMGEAKLDPFQMKLIPIVLNPIYHIGMFVAEWQADRYKVAKEELKLLQLRKLNLERMADGKPDAQVQKEIAYMEGRIQGLNYKIAKMEKDHA